MKVAYVATYLVAAVVLSVQVTLNDGSVVALAINRVLLDTVIIAIGVRSFRAAGEPVLPDRPWWKATGRPLASFIIAALWALTIVFNLLYLIVNEGPTDALLTLVSILASAAYVAFYLNSSLRLNRQPAGRRWISRTRYPEL